MKTWDFSDSKTWQGSSFQGFYMWAGITPEEYCDTAKAMFETELDNRKRLASQLRGEEPIDGLSIERALIALGKVVKIPKPEHYYAMATPIDYKLNAQAKQLIYGWLQDFLMNRPRKSIWLRAYTIAHRKKEREERTRRQRLMAASTAASPEDE